MTGSSRVLLRAGAVIAGVAAALGLWGCTEDEQSLGSRPIEADLVFGEPGTHPGQLAYPRAMAHRLGDLVIIDKTARVQVFEAETGRFITGWRTPEWANGKPTGLTIAPDPTSPGGDAIWVADTHYHRVLVYPWPDGEVDANPADLEAREPAFAFGAYGTGPGEFILPTDVAVLTEDGDETAVRRVYVSEYGGNDRVSVFDWVEGEPRFAFSFGAFGDGPGEAGSREGVGFQRPQSLEIDRERGELLVSDACNHRLGRFTLEGELIGWIDRDHLGEALRFPYGVSLVERGSALVAEYGAGRVLVVDLERNAVIGAQGRPGRGGGELAAPWAVAADGRRAFVLDSGNNRVMSFRPNR